MNKVLACTIAVDNLWRFNGASAWNSPKSWNELAIWAAMQFPELFATFSVCRWLLNRNDRLHDAERQRTQANVELLIAEKNARMVDRDAIVDEKKGEIAELRARYQRPRTPKRENR